MKRGRLSARARRELARLELAALMEPDPSAAKTYCFGLMVAQNKDKLPEIKLVDAGREILVERREAKKG